MGPPVIKLREESNRTSDITDQEVGWLLGMMQVQQYVVTDIYIIFGMAARFDQAWVIHPDHLIILEELCTRLSSGE